MGKPHRKETKMRRISGAYRWRYTDDAGREHIEYDTFSDFVSKPIADRAYAFYLMITGIHKSMQYQGLDPATDLLSYKLLVFSVEAMD